MGKRRKARESALQILFQLEFDNSQPDERALQYWKNKRASQEEKELCTQLVQGIVAHKKEVDKIIQSVSEHWRLSRMILVDKNILRIAAFELVFGEGLAPAIIINEAIEIAKKYSGEQSAVFVNGILDALNRDLERIRKSLEREKNE